MEWISVNDRLPAVDEYVLIYDGFYNEVYTGKILAGQFLDEPQKIWWYVGLDDEAKKNVTHWMPLPEPPAATAAGE